MKVKTIMKKIVAFAFVGIFGLGMAYVGANYIEEKSGGTVAVEQEQKNDNLVLGNVQENGIKLTMERKTTDGSSDEYVSTDGETAIVSAKIQTVGTVEDTSLSWTYEYHRFDYATTKTALWEASSTYITAEEAVEMVVSEDTYTATFTKRGDFACPITVTVSSVYDPTIRATLRLDCVGEIESVENAGAVEDYINVGKAHQGEYMLFSENTVDLLVFTTPSTLAGSLALKNNYFEYYYNESSMGALHWADEIDFGFEMSDVSMEVGEYLYGTNMRSDGELTFYYKIRITFMMGDLVVDNTGVGSSYASVEAKKIALYEYLKTEGTGAYMCWNIGLLHTYEGVGRGLFDGQVIVNNTQRFDAPEDSIYKNYVKGVTVDYKNIVF